MHISTLYMSTYSDKKPISGAAKIVHEETEISLNISDAGCLAIQQIIVDEYVADRYKHIRALEENTPALVALSAPEQLAEDAEFDPVEEEAYFTKVEDSSDQVPF